jgi:CRISPR-associated endonuclease/helicase Cas3
MSKTDLAPSDFTAFFKALWGSDYDPFPWQQDLLLRLAASEKASDLWPDVLDLPTGSGKTATLDIAVFHLALETAKGAGRRAPLRIAFVVDRRLIVDDAHKRAQHIAKALRLSLLDDEDATQLETSKPKIAPLIRRVRAEPVVQQVATCLQRLAGPCQPPLIARALRGGAPLEDDWARTPVQPAILCSTVDQVGSRLLFRGYGVSNSMKPVHAGLLGSDCLIFLDEAHLSEPFRQTLASIKDLRAPDKAPFDFAVLTATPRNQTVPFGLSDADRVHPVLSRRLNAEKPARLVEVAGKQGVDTESRRADVAAEHAKLVKEKLQTGGIACPAVGVVLNRVSRARAVFDRLEAELKGAAELLLIIGPARAADRNRHAGKLDPIRTGELKARGKLGKPLIVIATQTIEAGVDIDFDGLVTEAASLDALRQRFGRLNRAGRDIKPEAVILAHKEDLAAKADDAIYGDRIKNTWQALNRWQAKASDGGVDFGIQSMEAILKAETEPLSDLVVKCLNAPVFMPAYADLLSQTSPIPRADPDIVLFLHGPDRSPAAVQIIWRADIDITDLYSAWRDEDERDRLVDLFTLMPPRAAEAIEVPLWAARAWLQKPSVTQAEFSDVIEGASESDTEHGSGYPAFCWVGKDKKRPNKGNKRSDTERDRSRVVAPSKLQNGDLIIVPARYGGCDEWGWKPASGGSVTDVADGALYPYRARRFAVRVMPDLIVQGLHAEGKDGDPAIAERLAAVLAETEPRAGALLDRVCDLKFLPDCLRHVLASLEDRKGGGRGRDSLQFEFAYGFDQSEQPRGVVFLAPYGLKKTNADDLERAAIPSTENDDLGANSDGPILLLRHSQDVRGWADGFANRAGLPSPLREDIALSAYLHDPGKADPRYQAYYAGGDPYGANTDEVLAKSGRARLPRGAWERAGLPPDWRHEALSVRLALIHPDFKLAADKELVLWLIGTHHGDGRPLFPHADPKDAECRSNLLKAFDILSDLPPGPGPQSLDFTFNNLDWAQMFERLKRKYGIWGLARLEAFVRLSDHRASESGAPPEEASSVSIKEAAE